MGQPVKITILGDASSVRRALTQTAKGLDGLTSKLGSFAATASRRAAQVGAAVAAVGGYFGGKFVADLEASQLALTNMLGDASRGAEMYGQVVAMARKSPFDTQSLIDGAKQMLGLGMAADQIIPTLQTVVDVSAGLGMGPEEIKRFIKALSQMSAKGKLYAEEMTGQLSELGINGWGILAAKTGKSVEELQKMGAKGELVASKYLPMLLEGLREGTSANIAFAGSAEKLSTTWKGMWTRLKDEAGMALFGVAQAAKPLATAVFPHLVDWVRRTGTALSNGAQNFVYFLRSARQARLLDRTLAKVRALRDALGRELRPVFGAVRTAAGRALDAVITRFERARHTVKQVVGYAAPLLRSLRDVIVTALGDAGGVVSTTISLFTGLGGAAASSVVLLKPLFDMLSGLVGILAALPAPLQTAALAWLAFGRAARTGMRALGNTTPIKGFNEALALQQHLARMSGEEVGRYGGALTALRAQLTYAGQVLREKYPIVGRLADAYTSGANAIRTWTGEQYAAAVATTATAKPLRGIPSALTAVTAAAAGTANAVRVGLQSAVTGLIGALGGPWGVAIAAAVAGLSWWTSKQEEAAARQRQLVTTTSNFASTLDKSTGALTDATRAAATHELEQRGLIKATQEYGIYSGVLVDAILGQRSAWDIVTTKMREYIGVQLDAREHGKDLAEISRYVGMSVDEIKSALLSGGPELDRFRNKLDELGNAYAGANEKTLRMAGLDIIRNTEAIRGNKKALDELAEARRRAVEATQREAQAMGITLPSALNLKNAIDQLKSSTASAEEKARALSTALNTLNGDQMSLEQSVARSRELVDQMGGAWSRAAAQAREHGQALIDETGALNTRIPAGRELLTQTDQYAQSLYQVMQATYAKARAQGQDETAAANAAREAGERMVASYREQAIAAGGNTAEVDRLIQHYGMVPSDIATAILQPGMVEALLQLQNLKGSVERVPGEKKIVVDSNAIPERQEMERLGFKIRDLPNKKVEITASTTAANSALDSFLSRPARKVVDIVGRMLGPNAAGAIWPFAAGGTFAGHQLRAMTAGIARLVQPNTWRVIGDRPRDPEAYIPINREARSLAILRETARRMGEPLARDAGVRAVAATQVTNHYHITINATTTASPDEIGRSVAFAVKTIGR
ncbi:hypothetical protein GCM10012275_56360 [Longimycelium tulufanense]|uniref:Tape measure protein N-terminal domain-containing protein n=1 Tax=Longimycelium tulufanense TaxID=907463 RepID=A0A8J3FYS7_9PSEU|nr:tape measure protein [Longimycelium tulufanense]GGM78461.1 hypothetical protein GCM10012275_56360 [Longimycelium tulufanense]